MKLNLVCPLIVLDNEINPDIRKNDVKKFKLLVDNNNDLINVEVNVCADLKESIRDKISNIINSKKFHLEQVYTLGEEKYYFDNSIDIIYLAVTNIANIKSLDSNYKFVDFEIKNNIITLADSQYKFNTKERILNNNIEYYHEINVENIKLEKELLEIIIAYKQLRGKLDNSDIIFKFMPKYFTLGDLQKVYEVILGKKLLDPAFRRIIADKVIKTDKVKTGGGHRPSALFTYNDKRI